MDRRDDRYRDDRYDRDRRDDRYREDIPREAPREYREPRDFRDRERERDGRDYRDSRDSRDSRDYDRARESRLPPREEYRPPLFDPYRPPVAPRFSGEPNNTLYVGNLPKDTTERELCILFRFAPGFRSVRLIDKESRKFAFVDFYDANAAAYALDQFQRFRLDMNDPTTEISIEFDKTRRGGRR